MNVSERKHQRTLRRKKRQARIAIQYPKVLLKKERVRVMTRLQKDYDKFMEEQNGNQGSQASTDSGVDQS